MQLKIYPTNPSDCTVFLIFALLLLQVFRARTPPEAMDLVARLLEYTPSLRMMPLQACAHNFFDELREQGTRLPIGRELPPLFNFTEHELRINPALNNELLPRYMRSGDAAGAQASPATASDENAASAPSSTSAQAVSQGSAGNGNNGGESQNQNQQAAAQNSDSSQSGMA